MKPSLCRPAEAWATREELFVLQDKSRMMAAIIRNLQAEACAGEKQQAELRSELCERGTELEDAESQKARLESQVRELRGIAVDLQAADARSCIEVTACSAEQVRIDAAKAYNWHDAEARKPSWEEHPAGSTHKAELFSDIVQQRQHLDPDLRVDCTTLGSRREESTAVAREATSMGGLNKQLALDIADLRRRVLQHEALFCAETSICGAEAVPSWWSGRNLGTLCDSAVSALDSAALFPESAHINRCQRDAAPSPGEGLSPTTEGVMPALSHSPLDSSMIDIVPEPLLLVDPMAPSGGVLELSQLSGRIATVDPAGSSGGVADATSEAVVALPSPAETAEEESEGKKYEEEGEVGSCRWQVAHLEEEALVAAAERARLRSESDRLLNETALEADLADGQAETICGIDVEACIERLCERRRSIAMRDRRLSLALSEAEEALLSEGASMSMHWAFLSVGASMPMHSGSNMQMQVPGASVTSTAAAAVPFSAAASGDSNKEAARSLKVVSFAQVLEESNAVWVGGFSPPHSRPQAPRLQAMRAS